MWPSVLYHRMRQGVENLKKLNQGTSINGIVRDVLASTGSHFLRYRNRSASAEILSTVDEAIEQTEALIAKTQQIKAGLMHDLFTRGVTANGQLRPPREEAPQLYKQSPLGWIPREWDAGHLVDRRHPSRPHIKTGPFGSSLKLEHWADEGVPVMAPDRSPWRGGVRSGPAVVCFSEDTATRLSEYRLSEGDIVFSRVADVGRSAVITADEAGWVMSSNLMRITLTEHA